MAVDATVGGANADTYATVAEADAYHAARLHATSWSGATTPTKEAALKEACRLLDAAFPWTGAAVASTQALCWPRSGMSDRNGFAIATTVIPKALKDAQAEFARQLIDADRAADNDAEKQGLTSVKAGPVALTFRDSSVKSDEDLRAQEVGAINRIVPDAVRLLLVTSWYTQPTTQQVAVFEMI